VELLIVLAITALISVVVATRFSVFDSTVVLKNLAYEIAVSIRGAQSYSLSVLGDTTNEFNTAYGITFDLNANKKSYTFFSIY